MCAATEEKAYVSCCADVYAAFDPPKLVSMSTCDDLGWDPLPRGLPAICGENSLGLGGCSGELTFDEARLFCESKGARMCSIDDFGNDEAFGSSCDYEWELKWSSTECEADFEGGSFKGYSWSMGPGAMVSDQVTRTSIPTCSPAP